MLAARCLALALTFCTSTEVVVVSPDPRGVLSGRVAAADGATVSGQVVWEPMDQNGKACPQETTAIASDGWFRFDELPSFAGAGRLTIRAPGFRTALLVDVAAAIGFHRDVGTVTLERGERLHGRVIDTAGAPVAGARVVALPQWDLEAYRRTYEMLWEETVTDAEGRYAFDTLAPARHFLWILPSTSHAARMERAVYPGDALHESVLSPGKSVHGSLLDTKGRPLSGERIKLESARDLPERLQPMAITDAAGRFALEGLPRAAVRLELPLRGGLSAEERLVAADQTEVVLRIPCRGFRLVVRDAPSGEPLPVASLQIEERSSSRPQFAPLGDAPARFTGQTYRCKVPHERRVSGGPDRFAILVSAPQHLSKTIGFFDVPPDDMLELDCALERDAGSTTTTPSADGIEGVVRTSAGAPVQGARVTLNDADVFTDGDGRFALPRAAGIDGSLRAEAGALGACEVDGVHAAHLDLTLQPTASLTLRLTGASEALVQVDRGIVKHPSLYLSAVVRAFVSRSLRVDGLLPGIYYLKADVGSPTLAKSRVELGAGEQKEVALTIPEAVRVPRVEGRITVSGTPLAYRRVFVERAFGAADPTLATVAEALTDRDGRYSLAIADEPIQYRQLKEPRDHGFLVVEGPRSAIDDTRHQEGGMARVAIAFPTDVVLQRDLELVLAEVTVHAVDGGEPVRYRPSVISLADTERHFISPRGIRWQCVAPKTPFELTDYTFTLAAGSYRLFVRSEALGKRSVDFRVDGSRPLALTVAMSSAHELRVSAPRGTRRIDLYQRDPRQAFTDFVTGTERSDPQASVPVFTIRVVQPGEYLVVAWQSDERQVGASAEQSRVHQLLTVGEGDPPVLEVALGPE